MHGSRVYIWNVFMCIVINMLMAVIQPCKSKVYNTVDIVLSISLGSSRSGSMSAFIAYLQLVDPLNRT